MNGVALEVDEGDAYQRVIGLIKGRYSEQDIARWIEEHSTPVAPE